jgi:hypothetical protein
MSSVNITLVRRTDRLIEFAVSDRLADMITGQSRRNTTEAIHPVNSAMAAVASP